MKILGIDPGKSGGIALIDGERVVNTWIMPTTPEPKKRINTPALIDILSAHDVDKIYIEEQWVKKGQGGALTIGKNYGRILGILELGVAPIIEVRPKVWQSRMLAMQMYKTQNTKQASILYCRDRGWDVPMTSNYKNATPHDGVADALCIAAYGMELARVEAMMI
ncbi:MAG: hypothetical protein GY938_16795 [Ketobacter sp.]|nr:hypothetical protein [Ketobacter sp.]